MSKLQTLAAAIALTIPLAATAQNAFTTRGVNMRAGPDSSYPLVASLPPGASVSVGGCLNSYTWCDVYTGNVRGWVYANYLSYPYQSTQVPIYNYGPALGIPLITFSIGSYWDNNYRGRPFYGDRGRWESHPWHPPAARFAPNWRPPSQPHGSYRPPSYHPQQNHGDGRPDYHPPNNGGHPTPHTNRPPSQSHENRPQGGERPQARPNNNASGGEAGG